MSQELVNLAVPTGLNWNEQSAGSAFTTTCVLCWAACRAGLAAAVSALNSGKKVSAAMTQPPRDDRLAADFIGERPEEQESAGAEDERPGDEHVGRELIDLQDRLKEEQRVELAGVPDHGLAGGEAEQGEERPLGVAPLAERLGERRLRDRCPRPSSS